jgi:integrase
MLNHAVEDGLLGSNPAARVSRVLAPRRQAAREIYPLTREELTLLLTTVEQHAAAYYPLFLCLARTGLRLGEALALQWGDIDWHGRFVEVRRNYTLGKITTPKNGKTRRVDLSRQLTEVLWSLLTQRKAETLRNGWATLPPWVFCSQTGGLLDPDNVRSRVFYRCLEKTGLRHVRIHDLRHTYASLLLQQGESLAYIRDQLGHHSIQVTVDIYGHLVPGGNHAAVDRLDDTSSCNARATAQQGGNERFV